MVNSKGYRAGTRHLYSRDFRAHGIEHLSTFLVTYKRGDYVDIKMNGSVHKGMAHKYYHGRTGRVFDVTKRAVGIAINKRVGNRIIIKRIHVRIEHIRKSRCQEDFKKRIEAGKAAKAEFLKTGVKRSVKRRPGAPKRARLVSLKEKPLTIVPLKYDPMY
eukprot:c5928_g1_i1.p2 GENE.c5928_g1_i1~~c5928_g1_i1.p2  ORF type:complete len:160 (+),score=28.58 c5928_g1_i1:47-526(+)